MGSAEEGVKQFLNQILASFHGILLKSGESLVKIRLKSCRDPLKSLVSEGTGLTLAG